MRPPWELPLGAAMALSAVGCPATGAAQAPDTRVVTGTVRGSITGQAIAGAFVSIDGTRLSAASSDGGRFRIAEAPRHVLVLWARAIGYRPMSRTLQSGSDSVDVDLLVLEPRPHSSVSDTFPPLDLSETRAIWTALLRGLAGFGDAVIEHLAEVARAVPNANTPAPSGPAHVVLHLPPGSPRSLDDRAWHDDLVANRIIEGVCRSARAGDCRQAGFRLFVTLSPPGRFAFDSVVVAIGSTAIDADQCRRGRGMGDDGFESHLLVRVNNRWRHDGPDDTVGRMIGGIYCGRIAPR